MDAVSFIVHNSVKSNRKAWLQFELFKKCDTINVANHISSCNWGLPFGCVLISMSNEMPMYSCTHN